MPEFELIYADKLPPKIKAIYESRRKKCEQPLEYTDRKSFVEALVAGKLTPTQRVIVALCESDPGYAAVEIGKLFEPPIRPNYVRDLKSAGLRKLRVYQMARSAVQEPQPA